MAKPAKKVSLDAVMKSILRDTGVATQKDFDKLLSRINNLEKMVKNVSAAQKYSGRTAGIKSGGKRRDSATNTVLEIIKKSRKGIGAPEMQTKTGFDEKKVRNIVFRLNKLGKIKRVGRGKYTAESYNGGTTAVNHNNPSASRR